jgi:ribonuclease J
MSLKFIAISGTTDVTQNLYVYEYGDDMIIVDCGVGFPESEMYGVDLVIPDFTYIRQNAQKLRGVLITHGHEDHFGALPFLLKEFTVPIYATKLVAGFIEDKFADYGIKQEVKVFDPDRDMVNIGVFKITPFRTSHSVPDSVGYAIDTPEGRAFHIPDYKFDWTPVDGRPFDIAKLSILASEGALLLASDSLGSTSLGYTRSERDIESRVENVASSARGKILFTTISSNISRMQQAINVANKLKRKVVLVGRSIDSKMTIAKNFGYVNYPVGTVIPMKKARGVPREKLMYIISGSYGQPGSALDRVSQGEHDYVKVEPGDTVIFSGDPAPPGTKTSVDALVDRFIEAEVDVHYYDLQEDLHVSGHGSCEDIKMLMSIVHPKHLTPIGGSVRHNREYRNIAVALGHKQEDVFELAAGESIEFKEGNARRGAKVESKTILVDGLGIGDVGSHVLRDRKRLSQDGVVIVLIQIDKAEKSLVDRPEVISRGFVFEKAKGDLLQLAESQLYKEIIKRKLLDSISAKTATVDFLERFFDREIGRRPMILPVVVEM